eukprot:gnl/TRDRNA2_/TRDRNA2_177959_c7_seq22.p1 gnl/TRDRNA2_/TRDRNA2_177959_c7~~gnl/TRDRNA2_/TRDRNA2_177959_c7_seq22.p1  ORF type:complete len:265 (+),score=52.78 gnl/TRDRNA2_/TRDRNA2_177959_c7_seq22:87-797(+)
MMPVQAILGVLLLSCFETLATRDDEHESIALEAEEVLHPGAGCSTWNSKTITEDMTDSIVQPYKDMPLLGLRENDLGTVIEPIIPKRIDPFCKSGSVGHPCTKVQFLLDEKVLLARQAVQAKVKEIKKLRADESALLVRYEKTGKDKDKLDQLQANIKAQEEAQKFLETQVAQAQEESDAKDKRARQRFVFPSRQAQKRKYEITMGCMVLNLVEPVTNPKAQLTDADLEEHLKSDR